MSVGRELRRQVLQRAGNRCEYCQIPAELEHAPFQVDHIRAQKHRGPTNLDNLAWTCFPCNNHKSSNPAGFDPTTDEMQRLFNPRTDVWTEHFQWDGPFLIGKTPIGRTTIEVLEVNLADRIAYRRELLKEGLYPSRGQQPSS